MEAIDGVDLTSEMLAVARERGAHDTLREGVIDDRWIAVKPKWERYRHHPISVAYAWRR